MYFYLRWILFIIPSKQTLLEYAEKWKTSEDPLPLLEVYTVAIQSYVKARPYLTSECENVALVLERLALWVDLWVNKKLDLAFLFLTLYLKSYDSLILNRLVMDSLLMILELFILFYFEF